MEHLEAPQYDVEVSEQADDQAEEGIITDKELQDYKITLVETFDSGLNWSSAGREEFNQAFEEALDELIDVSARNLVNTDTLSPTREKFVKHAIMQYMTSFSTIVAKDIGIEREADDVAKAKKSVEKMFTIRQRSFTPPEITEAYETNNDAEVSFLLLTDSNDAPAEVQIKYQEPGNVERNMSVETAEIFLESQAQTVEGTIAHDVRQNREAYRIDGVNYEIQDPHALLQFVHDRCGPFTGNNPNPTRAYRLAIDLAKTQLRIASSNEEAGEKMAADNIPIDQLIRGVQDSPTCCRHYTAAVTTIFEQMQILAKRAGNDLLDDIVAFENDMSEMAHATVAFARGNEVTVSDPLWYATGAIESPDATFSGSHANLTSLYRTLSKVPEGQPERRIFDMGSAEKYVVRMKGMPEEGDNQIQRYLMRTREVLLREELQTPENLINTSDVIFKTALRIGTINSDIERVHATALQAQAKYMALIIDSRLTNQTLDTATREQLEYELSRLRSNVLPFLNSKITGTNCDYAIANAYEDASNGLSETSRESLLQQTGETMCLIAKQELADLTGELLFAEANPGKREPESWPPSLSSHGAQRTIDAFIQVANRLENGQQLLDQVASHIDYIFEQKRIQFSSCPTSEEYLRDIQDKLTA